MRSSVFRWPDAEAVATAARTWAAVVRRRPGVRDVGYFGSYARGDWGVGSDLDLVVVVDAADERFERRGLALDTASLPVPSDLLVYTTSEWRRLVRESAFHTRIQQEAVWL